MALIDPLKEEFLAVVTSWSAYGQKGGLVGSALPIFCTSRQEVVHDPEELFPDRGYIFLVNRGSVMEWDFILVRPKKNDKYVQGKSYFLSFDITVPLETHSPDCRYASILDVPTFDPTAVQGILRNPTQNVTPIFYVRSQRKMFGPLRRIKVNRKSGSEALDSIQWAPLGDDGSLYEFAEDEFAKYRLEKGVYRHPNPDDEPVGRHPLFLTLGPVLTAKSDKVFDRLSPVELAEWFLRRSEIPEVSAPILNALRTAPDYLDEMTPEMVRQRCRRLSKIFETLDVLQTERSAIAARYLESEGGQKLLTQLLDREVERRAKLIDSEVAQLKKEQSKEKYRLKQEMDALVTEHQAKVRRLVQESETLEKQRLAASEAVSTLQEQIREGVNGIAGKLQHELPMYAALVSGMRPTVIVPEGQGERLPAIPGKSPSTWGKSIVPPLPSRELDAVSDESTFVDQLVWEFAGESLYFTRDFLANLYITMKSSPLNLIMGPPGYGKSSAVGGLARALGHGNALLEIAVRRTWSDDRYLLGFYDTFHGRFDPGPTGLATRLLQAQLDWESGRNGLYFILMDEFNLAAPEYYFSQLLQVLSRPVDQRTIRLYDPGTTAPSTEEKPIDQVRLYPNLGFWGTINYDETTERLSPRLLDRTGMIFLGVRDVVPAVSGNNLDAGGGKGIKAGEWVDRLIRNSHDCPDDAWLLLEPILAMLKRTSEEWGAGIDLSPRVLEACKRYLANAKGLLPIERAVDFVFEQRVLPVLRGRGPKFTARMRALVEQLTPRGLERSARHIQDAVGLAEVNFGDVDFLAY